MVNVRRNKVVWKRKHCKKSWRSGPLCRYGCLLSYSRSMRRYNRSYADKVQSYESNILHQVNTNLWQFKKLLTDIFLDRICRFNFLTIRFEQGALFLRRKVLRLSAQIGRQGRWSDRHRLLQSVEHPMLSPRLSHSRLQTSDEVSSFFFNLFYAISEQGRQRDGKKRIEVESRVNRPRRPTELLKTRIRPERTKESVEENRGISTPSNTQASTFCTCMCRYPRRCVEYELDESQPKIYQWFDVPLYWWLPPPEMKKKEKIHPRWFTKFANEDFYPTEIEAKKLPEFTTVSTFSSLLLTKLSTFKHSIPCYIYRTPRNKEKWLKIKSIKRACLFLLFWSTIQPDLINSPIMNRRFCWLRNNSYELLKR